MLLRVWAASWSAIVSRIPMITYFKKSQFVLHKGREEGESWEKPNNIERKNLERNLLGYFMALLNSWMIPDFFLHKRKIFLCQNSDRLSSLPAYGGRSALKLDLCILKKLQEGSRPLSWITFVSLIMETGNFLKSHYIAPSYHQAILDGSLRAPFRRGLDVSSRGLPSFTLSIRFRPYLI